MSLDPLYSKKYCEKIKEYLEKGYAGILSEDETSRHYNKAFYFPYFGVRNPNKIKVCFAFDAAAKFQNISLNKALLAGRNRNLYNTI